MSKNDYVRRRLRERQKAVLQRFPMLVICLLLICAIGTGIFFLGNYLKNNRASSDFITTQTPPPSEPGSDLTQGTITEMVSTTDSEADKLAALLAQSSLLAASYDYDGAIALLLENPQYAANESIIEAIANYESIKSTLVKTDVTQITHVFFHTLIIDTAKAFDEDFDSKGYNQMMTTKEEFIKMMQSMYDRGFVLVSLHDMAYEVTAEDGSTDFVKGEIMLPPGKKAFVLSQDDTCYYEYMAGDGFASRMIVGEDGKPTCEMIMDDGSIAVGEYDVVPVLERFIQEHPGFSYQGARGVIAFTGYNGILGYRTAPSYSESPTYEEDKAAATKVAQSLRDAGWELASHSWGHRDMGTITYDDFKLDTDKWEAEVESLIGPTDIILFPFGSDIGGWMPYTDDNERFDYLKSVGFRYFCNVDSSQYWVQIGKDHLRQGRRNLDGYRMYYDMIDPDSHRLDDLFDVNEVFDKSRPTPVAPMG